MDLYVGQGRSLPPSHVWRTELMGKAVTTWYRNFDSYEINHYSGPPAALPLGSEVRINCYVASPPDRKLVATLIFIKDGSWMPPNQTSIPTDPTNPKTATHGTAFYPLSRFMEVVTTLRYEKPIHVWINVGVGKPSGGIAGIGTGEEPVGDEEGS